MPSFFSALIRGLWRKGSLSFLLLAALGLPVRGGTPRDELLRLVPEPVGFCLVLQDLRGHAANFLASPFVEQCHNAPLFAPVRKSKEVEKLRHFQARLKGKLGLEWAQFRDDVLGGAVVFAYRPGPPGRPEEEQGLILVRGQNARVLADLVERLNKVQREEGEVRNIEERTHKGITYYRREERKAPTYYYLHGPVLMLSSQEAILQQAIEREQAMSTDTEPVIASRLRELGADDALFAIWANPRAFDADVAAKAERAPADHAGIAKQFAVYWKALESVVLSLKVQQDLQVSLGIRARTQQLPAGARRFLAEAALPSEVWRRTPANALLAVGGRIDGAALFETLSGFLTPESRVALVAELNRNFGSLLGGDFIKEVLPALGPDWGWYLTAPSAQDKGWVPQAVFALRVVPNAATAPVDRTLISTLNFFAQIAVFGHNRQHPEQPLMFKTSVQDKHEVQSLSGERVFPSGVRPGYALWGGYLVLASSLEGLTRFTQAKPEPPPAASIPVPLLRLSFKDWRAYLKERREPIVQFVADRNGLSREAAKGRIENLLAILQFFDHLELRQRSGPGQVIFTLSVETAQPLKR
jgi:hypothetical protein